MKLDILDRSPGLRYLCTDGRVTLGARGNRVLVLEGDGARRTLADVGAGWERTLAVTRLSRQFLRLGVHHGVALPDGGHVVVLRKRLLRLGVGGEIEAEFRFPRGNKPGSRGVCLTPTGDLLVAEYALNGKRLLPAMLHRSRDGGRTFQVVHSFEPGRVRHYHFVQWDPFEKCLWMGTGDADHECMLYRSDDQGDTWRRIGGGSQLWRAVGLTFRADGLYWGTDAGSDAGTHPNFVVRLGRGQLEPERLLEIQGPCHGNATLADGTLLVSTGVERGINEKDGRAHLWASRDGRRWHELLSLEKDLWPGLVQFGVIRFPMGLEAGTDVLFTTFGLAGAPETAFRARIEGGP